MGSLYVLVVDLHPRRWHELSETISLEEALNQICVFLNAQLSVHVSNTLAVIAAAPKKSAFLYPSPVRIPSSDDRQELFSEMNATVLANATKLYNEQSGVHHACDLAGALSKALCYINRQTAAPATAESSAPSQKQDASGRGRAVMQQPGTEAAVPARIGVVSVSPESSIEYFAAMNCIFAAQKKEIPIDVLSMGEEAAILQQAAHLTDGIYLNVSDPKQLLQTLMTGFITSHQADALVSPVQRKINFDASCFCHGRTVDIGFVCTVCLSVYCEKLPGCKTCGADFTTANT